jgi:protein-glutamine gamma-glutamyltransferase
MNRYFIIILFLVCVSCKNNLTTLSIDSREIKKLLQAPDLNITLLKYWDKTFTLDIDKKSKDFLDSLTQRNDILFPLNFLTLNTIVAKSDGALSELMGSYCLKMILNYPKETFLHFESDSLDRNNYALFIGLELYLKKQGTSDLSINYHEFKDFLTNHLDLSDNHVKITFNHFLSKVDYIMKYMISDTINNERLNSKADAQVWLERRSTATDEQDVRLQAIVCTYLPGTHFIDVNGDGKVGVEDLVWAKNTRGNINVQLVDKVLVDRIRVDAAVVNVCYLMARARHDYALTSQIKISPTFWVCTLDKGFFRVAEGVRPSAAVNDIFDNPKQYRFPTNVATTIVYLKAMLDLLGPNDFDRVVPRLQMGRWSSTDFVQEMAKVTGTSHYPADQQFRDEIRAGDEAYFLNPRASPEAKKTRGAAQCAIYLGDGKWYSHPFGITTEKAILDYLNSTTVPGVGDMAHMTRMQTRMNTELLSEDKDPN